MSATDRVLLFDVNEERAAKIAATFHSLGLVTEHCRHPTDARVAFKKNSPVLAVVIGADEVFPGLGQMALDHEVPSLAVVEPGGDPRLFLDRVRRYRGWSSMAELSIRVAEVLDRSDSGTRPISTSNSAVKPPTIDPRFLALVIHDLRTPLNVIGLTIRAIAQSAPPGLADLEEDLTFLTENARQIEKMLAQLADYCRLVDAESHVSGAEFDPRRFLSDFLEDRPTRPGVVEAPVQLELAESCPTEVSLDPLRVKLALQHALANVLSASTVDSKVRLRASGRSGKLVIEFFIEKPPPPTVSSIELRSDQFERLTGVAAERRGLDLAIAARVTELFHGQARLEVEPGRRSVVVLEWPERLATV